MNSPRQRAAEGLQVGDHFSIQRCFSDDDIRAFAQLSRDYNPVHHDEAYIALKGMRAPIAHGLLTASLITEIGGQIGWLAMTMTFRFKRPVYVGELLTCDWVIESIDERGRGHARVTVTNGDGVVVLESETSGVLPDAAERQRLAELLVEDVGDVFS